MPRTSGVALKRPITAKNEFIKLLDKNGNIHPLVELAIRDIFRRLDKHTINNILEF